MVQTKERAMIDKDVRAVFIGAIVSMLLSSIALRNHPTECYIEATQGKEVKVYIGHTLPKVEGLAHD
jgi:hypothetical protein